MAIETIQIAGFVGCSDYTPSSLAVGYQDFRTMPFFTMGDDLKQFAPNSTILESDYIRITKDNSGNQMVEFDIRNDPNAPWRMAGNWSTVNYNSCSFLFAIDNDTQKGSVLCCSSIPGGYYSIDNYTAWTLNDSNDMYLALTNSLPVLYTWSSVPSISGKNGILSLPTLIDTDGEPISGQSASVFSSLPEGSNVRALINGAL